MRNKLTLQIYPKHNRTACMVMKSDNHLYRINHFWHYAVFVDELELMCRRINKGMHYFQSLDLCDKRNGHWALVCSFSGAEANIELWDNPIAPKKPVFSWSGMTTDFQAAVANLLKMLR